MLDYVCDLVMEWKGDRCGANGDANAEQMKIRSNEVKKEPTIRRK